MKIFQVNGSATGSTGKIMFGISKIAEQNDFLLKCATPITKTNRKNSKNISYIKIGTYYSRCFSVLLSRITGFNDCFSWFNTQKLIKNIHCYSPDILHLHNLHGSYLHLPSLFKYIKKHDIRVIWTLHDCWSFTGHCPHFDMIGCNKWKTGCYKCPQYRNYPKSYIDQSKFLYKQKKNLFSNIKNLTIITPSQWLANLVKQSFLKDYQIKVIHNGIDLSIFKPTNNDFRIKYHCENKFILLGVAFGWGERKGLDVFIELAKNLDERFQIVLVGTDDRVDKLLPENIISIHRTQNQTKLAELYTAADLFVNPTREDTFPTVNIESLACGTPVITFKTGGSPEIIDNSCGIVVEKNDISTLQEEIKNIFSKMPFSKEACLLRAKNFNMYDNFQKYIDLYGE